MQTIKAAGTDTSSNRDTETKLLVRYPAAAAILRGETPTPLGPDAPRAFDDPAEAGQMLIASAKELADAVRGLSDDDLMREYISRRGPMPGYLLMEVPLRNMHYHGGQMNMLQLCYGDTEFRVPMPPKKD